MLNRCKISCLYLLAGIVLPLSAPAGDLYKWQDENGIWHFSSLPPQGEEDYATVEMPADPKKMVDLRKLGTEREPEYAFFNNSWGPIELNVELLEADNVLSEPPLPARFVIPGQTEQRVLKIRALDPSKGFRFRLSYQQMIGPPLDTLPPEYDYYPPFPLGMTFPISQGFDNDETHKEPANEYAVDIVMPVGTPILAARSGMVMDMEDNFHGAGQEQRYLRRSNQVRILHDDGTMAVYAHLKADSIRVRPGTSVDRGQWIADSGNTGFSSGPHLHFVIQLNAGMSLQSLPFRFKAPAGGTITPENRMMISGVSAQP
jgi:murein DD-endopeptidase MepM/ murein hydrolase activator NlpD